MTPDQAALLHKAHSSLRAAHLLAGEKLFDFAVSRAYYTMFYVAKPCCWGIAWRFLNIQPYWPRSGNV